MEELKEKMKKKSILRKTWDRCKSLGHAQTQSQLSKKNAQAQSDQEVPFSPSITPPKALPRLMVKSKSWSYFPSSPSIPRLGKRVGSKKIQVDPTVPSGYFSVYVGPDKQRFVIKVECTSHPLFKMLLEEAELEYGYHSDGPLVLPCDVNVFIKVLFEMDGDDDQNLSKGRCGAFPKSRSYYHLLTLPGMVSLNQL